MATSRGAPVAAPYNPGSYPAGPPGFGNNVPGAFPSAFMGQMPAFFGTNYGNYESDPAPAVARQGIQPNYVQTQTVKAPPIAYNETPVNMSDRFNFLFQPDKQLQQIQRPQIQRQQMLQQQLQQPQQQAVRSPSMQGFVPSPNAPAGAPTHGQFTNNAGRTLGYDYSPGSTVSTQGGINYGMTPAGAFGAAQGVANSPVGYAGGYNPGIAGAGFTPGTGPGGAYAGSGAAGGKSVLCYYFAKRGWMPWKTYEAMRSRFTYSHIVRVGYLTLATPLVVWMFKRSIGAQIVEQLLWPFVKAYAAGHCRPVFIAAAHVMGRYLLWLDPQRDPLQETNAQLPEFEVNKLNGPSPEEVRFQILQSEVL